MNNTKMHKFTSQFSIYMAQPSQCKKKVCFQNNKKKTKNDTAIQTSLN